MLNNPAWVATTAKRTAGAVQVKRWVGAVCVAFMPGHRKTFPEVSDAVILVRNSLPGYPDLSADVSVFEVEIVEEHDCGPSDL